MLALTNHGLEIATLLTVPLLTLLLQVSRIEEEEFCFIPMGGAIPVRAQRVVAFGGALGLVHPSTGYQICRAMAAAGPAAKVIAREVSKQCNTLVFFSIHL